MIMRLIDICPCQTCKAPMQRLIVKTSTIDDYADLCTNVWCERYSAGLAQMQTLTAEFMKGKAS